MKRLLLISAIYLMVMMWCITCFAELKRPDPETYPNPYKLCDTDYDSMDKERGQWIVVCNQDGAPIYSEPDGKIINNGQYLELFRVKDKKGCYLSVKSIKRKNITGWINMKHFILILRAIKDPDTKIYYKAFIRVKIDQSSGINEDLFRFRKGPGRKFEFLTKKGDIDRVSNLFYYVYAVYSDNSKFDYNNAKEFKNAKYFLLGNSPTISTLDIERGYIVGWISNEATVLWDTRQALEKVPNRPNEDWDAHIFPDRPLLNRYFLGDSNEKKRILEEYGKNIVEDHGEGPPETGQILRYINLSRPDDIIKENGSKIGQSAFIGYTGRGQGVSSKDANIHSLLADLQEGSKYLEIFFLVDATQSMKECLKAASSISKYLIESIKQKEGLRLSVYGAVYRDKRAGNGWNGWYEECSSSDPREVADFFSNAKIYNEKDIDDYPEALFKAINESVKKWRTNGFKHKYSTRVMLILSDACDNGRSGFIWTYISDELKKNVILPIAIHLKHEPKSEKEEKKEKEKDAMEKFPEQMEKIMKEIYNTDFPVKVFSISGNAMSEKIKEYVKNIENHVERVKNALPEIRRGKKRMLDIICEDGYNKQKLISKCKECKSMDDLMNFIKKYKPSVTREKAIASIGFPIAKFKLFAEKNPHLRDIIFKRPELGFAQGYIVFKKREKFITRPVLLLHERELQNLLSSFDNLPRNCRSKENSNQVVAAIKAVIGELMDCPARNRITNEDLQDILKVRLGSPESFIGAENIIENLCEDDNKWNSFLDKLDRIREELRFTIYEDRSSPRLYRDIHNLRYYWYRPDELFPIP